MLKKIQWFSIGALSIATVLLYNITSVLFDEINKYKEKQAELLESNNELTKKTSFYEGMYEAYISNRNLEDLIVADSVARNVAEIAKTLPPPKGK